LELSSTTCLRDLIAGTFPDISDHWDTPGSSQQSEEERFVLVSVFGSGLDPDSIRSVDPDPYSESGSKRAKMTHKSRQKLRNFMF
jgi:hypothetical protein